MNIDKFLKFFVPKDHSFYPLFEEDAKNLVKAAELLKTAVIELPKLKSMKEFTRRSRMLNI